VLVSAAFLQMAELYGAVPSAGYPTRTMTSFPAASPRFCTTQLAISSVRRVLGNLRGRPATGRSYRCSGRARRATSRQPGWRSALYAAYSAISEEDLPLGAPTGAVAVHDAQLPERFIDLHAARQRPPHSGNKRRGRRAVAQAPAATTNYAADDDDNDDNAPIPTIDSFNLSPTPPNAP
jgi:hypothetical protein